MAEPVNFTVAAIEALTPPASGIITAIDTPIRLTFTTGLVTREDLPSAIAMNALMSLPFVARVLMPALAQSAEAHDRLCLSLGLRGLARFRLVELPVMKRAIGLALVVETLGQRIALGCARLGVGRPT